MYLKKLFSLSVMHASPTESLHFSLQATSGGLYGAAFVLAQAQQGHEDLIGRKPGLSVNEESPRLLTVVFPPGVQLKLLSYNTDKSIQICSNSAHPLV